jgi:hypothetical protein
MIDLPPELKQQAVLLAAHYAMGEWLDEPVCLAFRVRQLADSLIWADNFDDAVFEAQDQPLTDEVAHAFFATVGVQPFTAEQAVWWILRYRLTAITNGTAEPNAGLTVLVNELAAPHAEPLFRRHWTDRFGFKRLKSLWFSLQEIEEMTERDGVTPDMAAIEAETNSVIVAGAQRWLAAQLSGTCRHGLFATAFPNRLEATMRLRR